MIKIFRKFILFFSFVVFLILGSRASATQVISNVNIIKNFSNVVYFQWETTEPEAMELYLGSTINKDPYGNDILAGVVIKEINPVVLHKLTYANQIPAAKYFRICGKDGCGKIFDLPAGEGYDFYNDLKASNISSSSAVISWTTSEPGINKVYYNQKGIYIYNKAGSDELTTFHSVKIENLRPGIEYEYAIEAIMPYKIFDNQISLNDYNSSPYAYKIMKSTTNSFSTISQSNDASQPDLILKDMKILRGG